MTEETKLLQELIFEQNYYRTKEGYCSFCGYTQSHSKTCLITKVIDILSHITVDHNGEEVRILIDREDYERLSEYKWYQHDLGSIYAYDESKRKIILQKFILNDDTSHMSAYNKNGDPRDYRKMNLERCVKQMRSARMKRAMKRRQSINLEADSE